MDTQNWKRLLITPHHDEIISLTKILEKNGYSKHNKSEKRIQVRKGGPNKALYILKIKG